MSRPCLHALVAASAAALAACGHAAAPRPVAPVAPAHGPALPPPPAPTDDVCAHPEAALEMPSGEVSTIDVGGVIRAIDGHRGQLRRCYERYLKRDAAAGRVIATLAIGHDGRVAQVQVQGFAPPLDRCLCHVVARVRFPAPEGTAIVSYPMDFSD